MSALGFGLGVVWGAVVSVIGDRYRWHFVTQLALVLMPWALFVLVTQ